MQAGATAEPDTARSDTQVQQRDVRTAAVESLVSASVWGTKHKGVTPPRDLCNDAKDQTTLLDLGIKCCHMVSQGLQTAVS